jgi:hypothetical protein
LGNIFSHRISIFPRENELIFLGKMEILLGNVVPKLALIVDLQWYNKIQIFRTHPSSALCSFEPFVF